MTFTPTFDKAKIITLPAGDYVTANYAAEVVGTDPQCLRLRLHKRGINAVKISQVWLIPVGEVEKLYGTERVARARRSAAAKQENKANPDTEFTLEDLW